MSVYSEVSIATWQSDRGVSDIRDARSGEQNVIRKWRRFELSLLGKLIGVLTAAMRIDASTIRHLEA
jgi:hypothetical protein